jgi:uncharacterized protein
LPYYQPVYAGIDVARLIGDSSNLLKILQSIGIDGIGDFVDRLAQDSTLLPVVYFVMLEIER